MTIVNPLAYTIQNGQAVDAVPVMANLNQIVSNVNANAAPVSGNAAQTFAVANATATNQAVARGQVLSVNPVQVNGSGGTTANTTYQTSGSFTAPCAGVVVFTGMFNNNSTSAMGDATLSLYINGTPVAVDAPGGAPSWNLFGFINIASGAAVTATMQYTVGSTALSYGIYMRGIAWFMPQP